MNEVKRKGLVLVTVNKTNRRVGEGVNPIARQLDRLTRFIVERRLVGAGGEFQDIAGQPFRITAALRDTDGTEAIA